MPQVITNISFTTELEAVNAMLSAIGEAPITDVSTATQADVVMAVNLLRNATREVQSMGWRFNTEHGFQLAPTATYDWVDSAGLHTLLNIFTPPANMLRFTVTPIPEQQGSKVLDTVLRPSRRYLSGGLPILVFYDRVKNRDGFDSTDIARAFIYIEPVWAFNFEMMPEEARRFCAIHAARQFIQQVVGAADLAGFTATDERMAFRNLKREFGEQDDYNMLQNTDVYRMLGNRPRFDGAVMIDSARKNNS